MTQRRTFLKTAGVVGCTGALAGCLGIGGEPFNDGEIDFNVSPSVPQSDLEVQYAPIREFLSNEFDTTTKMNLADNYSAVIEALGAGTTDIAETGPFAAALGVKDDNAEIILQRKGFGTWTYKSIIAVRNDSDIEEVGDLEGRSVAFSDPLSTSGALYPLYNISQADVDIGNLPSGNGSGADFEAVFAGGHVSSYEQLVEGQVDAAGMGGFVRDTGAGPSPDEFESNARTLAESTGLPRAPIVVSPELSDDRKEEVQQAVIDAPQDIYWGQDGEEGTDDDLWFNDVREAGVDKYQSVIDVATELGVGTDVFESG
jgi:phosphonate transport system substrate-binding protein